MHIKKQQLIALFKEAFDEGWFGYFELKDEFCERLAAETVAKYGTDYDETKHHFGEYLESPIRRK